MTGESAAPTTRVRTSEGNSGRGAGLLSTHPRRAIGLLLVAALLATVFLLSLRIGSVPISTSAAVDAITEYDDENNEQIIVRTLRLPRTLIGLGVGASLAVAGGIMQAVTRNALAGPGILGVNAGAAFAIVTSVYFLGISQTSYVWYAFAGALITALVVYGVGSVGRSGATPVKLALAGVVISALLGSWTSTLLVFSERTLDEVRFWLAGSLTGNDFEIFRGVIPFMVVGVAAGILIARQLNALSLGDEVAKSLGQRIDLIRGLSAGLVVMLAGAAVAAAGPIGFVGLAVPHIARGLVGPDYRWVQAYALLLGPVLLLSSDIAARILVNPAELAVGIVTACVGAPFLIYLARRSRLASV